MSWLVLSLLLAADPGTQATLPPGQDDAFADMLGRGGEPLPDGCRWNGALIDRSFIISQYDCGAGILKLTLKHPTDINAPSAIARTERFVLFGEIPTGLREELVKRIRAGEAGIRWDFTHLPSPGVDKELKAPFPWGLAVVVVLAVFVATLATLTIRWAAKRGRLSERGHAVARVLACIALSVAGAALLRDAFWHTTVFAVGELSRAPSHASIVFDSLLGAGVLALASSLVRRGGLTVSLTLVGSALVFWLVTLPRTELTMFGEVSTLSPGTSAYPLNSRGFRGPEFALEKKPGVFRVALIGDSFVEGDGILDEKMTLAMQLQRELATRNPNGNYEVLNLGIAGNNFASHVTTTGEALKQLDLDAVVVCLTLNNDLSPVDGQVLRAAARRPSAFSFLRAVLGDSINTIVLRLTAVGHETSARDIEHGAKQSARLAALQKQFPKVKVHVFAFHGLDRELFARFEQPVIVPPTFDVGDFIAGDGHPTDHGAGRFAQILAEALLREASP